MGESKARGKSPAKKAAPAAVEPPPARRGTTPTKGRVSTLSGGGGEKKKENKTWGGGGFFANRELGALTLVVLCPFFILSCWYIVQVQKGSLTSTWEAITKGGFSSFLMRGDWAFGGGEKDEDGFFYNVHPFNRRAWQLIGVYMAFELVLQRWLPGKEFKGNVTLKGHTPVYNANGVQSYLVTVAALFACKYHYETTKETTKTGFNPSDVYDEMGHLLGSINVFALLFCLFLTYKGLNFPSTPDSGTNGSTIMDYFWGTDLYPNILGWDVKQFTNCRFGMMFWQVGILCYAMKQHDLGLEVQGSITGLISDSMLVSVLVQSVYIFKFFWWETGYFKSMDIQHDRAGYYICFGCLCWVPSIYTLHTLYLTENPIVIESNVSFFFIIAGILCIWCNYDCDRQRQEFRETNGKLKVWGKEKVKFIKAKYTIEDTGADGKKQILQRESLLLADGWWGLSRHIHYVPEVLASVFW